MSELESLFKLGLEARLGESNSFNITGGFASVLLGGFFRRITRFLRILSVT